jgi:hypothetical protein
LPCAGSAARSIRTGRRSPVSPARNLRGDLTSGCYNLTVGFRAHAWDIKRWLKKPVDGAQIGR